MIKNLPKKVEADLNNNVAFNMFGLINLSRLKSSTGTRLSSKELIKRINNRFKHEMTGGRIDFIGRY